MALIEFAIGVGLLWLLQKVGREIENEAQGMGLPPNFDRAAFLRMQAQNRVVSKRCYTKKMS